MYKIAKFYKVSYEQWKKDFLGDLPVSKTEWSEEELVDLYNCIELPKRATTGSAGYDFKAYLPFTLKQGETIKIPTGIKVAIEEGWFLGILPRSGHGFKYRIQLDNTEGIIDSDYINSDNEGHIFVKLTNDAKKDKTLEVKVGDGYCQGIFQIFGITEDDEADAIRNGGMGSTTKR